jgi:hypothetical protein
METNEMTSLFYIIVKLIWFVLIMAAFRHFTQYNIVGRAYVLEQQTTSNALGKHLKVQLSTKQHSP